MGGRGGGEGDGEGGRGGRGGEGEGDGEGGRGGRGRRGARVNLNEPHQTQIIKRQSLAVSQACKALF